MQYSIHVTMVSDITSLPKDNIRFLKKGDKITLQNNSIVVVSTDIELGHGGQGHVYRVTNDDGDEYALKWITEKKFFKQNNPEYYKRVYKLANHKDVREKGLKNFALPIELTEIEESGQFGYLMEIMPEKMVPLGKILSGSRNFSLFDVELTACRNIARSFSILARYHSMFTDINEGSIFIDLDTGDVKICDCDNIAFEGDKVTSIGKMGFMAREVCLKKECSCQSDCFSIAVLFYYILFRDDPFSGKKWEGVVCGNKEDKKKYITEPIFTMDPDTEENRPRQEIIDNWNKVPDDIKECFYDSLAHGIDNKKQRTKANTWSGSFDTWLQTLSTDPFYALDMKPVPRKTQIVIFIIDSSRSMKGKKMQEVNDSISKSIQFLKEVERDNHQVHFKVGILQFSDDAQWFNEECVVDIDDFIFDNLNTTGTFTQFDLACMALDKEFDNTNGVIDSELVYKRPFLLLVSDGWLPKSGYQDYLDELRTNRFFKRSLKYAIGVDDGSESLSKEMLVDFTNDEDLIKTFDSINGDLGRLIYNLTMTISTINSDEEEEKLLKDLGNDAHA